MRNAADERVITAMLLKAAATWCVALPPLAEAVARFARSLGSVAAAVLPTSAEGLLGVLAGVRCWPP